MFQFEFYLFVHYCFLRIFCFSTGQDQLTEAKKCLEGAFLSAEESSSSATESVLKKGKTKSDVEVHHVSSSEKRAANAEEDFEAKNLEGKERDNVAEERDGQGRDKTDTAKESNQNVTGNGTGDHLGGKGAKIDGAKEDCRTREALTSGKQHGEQKSQSCNNL